tara:strand:+ start:6225 stop:6410 length:186 start_codon:yes stop_codon:yes gene_type:complete
VGICGVYESKALPVRVERLGGFKTRPDMTIMGLLNWWAVMVCVCMFAILAESSAAAVVCVV